jgi:ribosomal protein S18 acetylase RimI-like enzyme
MSGALVSIRALTADDAGELAGMLTGQPTGYLAHFTPFSFELAAVADMLERAREDVYAGVYWDAALIGFYMLRGWDAGYAIPAYGVAVSHAYRNRGIGRLTLDAAIATCQLRGCSQVMLKVHPQNAAARHLYAAVGFQETGVDPINQNVIMHVRLAAP